jgi:hypothetical protein
LSCRVTLATITHLPKDSKDFPLIMLTFRAPFLLLILSLGLLASRCSDSVPPSKSALFGPNVYIFEPGSQNVQDTISRIYAAQMNSEFSEGRYAILFRPGKYNLDVRVGYYTQVSGLGDSPDDVMMCR